MGMVHCGRISGVEVGGGCRSQIGSDIVLVRFEKEIKLFIRNRIGIDGNVEFNDHIPSGIRIGGGAIHKNHLNGIRGKYRSSQSGILYNLIMIPVHLENGLQCTSQLEP